MKKAFFIGIGGAGMSKLALLFKSFGYEVSGSDIRNSSTISNLQNKGIRVFIGHDESHITSDLDLVVFSSAVKTNNPEYRRAVSLAIPIMKRGEALAKIVNNYKSVVVSGTHGKTTTTSLIGHIFKNIFDRVNVYVGGEDAEFDTFVKKPEYFVVESDESDGSFLYLKSNFFVITNIDKDHLTYYDGSFRKLQDAFRKVAKRANHVVYCADDENALAVGKTFSNSWPYGIKNDANMYARDIEYLAQGIKFVAIFKDSSGNEKAEINVPLFGEKNVLNVLAALLVSKLSGIDLKKSADALKNFVPPHRRMEIKHLKNNIILIDDHADHPTEVGATLSAVKKHFPTQRIIAVFQPHRYSRVATLGEEIGKPFFNADIILSMEIYPAFEKQIPGINGALVYKWVKSYNQNKKVYFAKTEKDVINTLLNIMKDDDVVVLLGPGNISELAGKLLSMYRRN
jgi:UDP-N-acetylmuramate--alanine ligase